MAGYYQLKKSGDQYMFNLKAGNHETILTSERYKSKQGAEGASRHARRTLVATTSTSARPPREISRTSCSRPELAKVLGRSEIYSSPSAMEGGIASCKANGPTATMKDET
jgi:uncharacterized protein YegP (UPF0339 family)